MTAVVDSVLRALFALPSRSRHGSYRRGHRWWGDVLAAQPGTPQRWSQSWKRGQPDLSGSRLFGASLLEPVLDGTHLILIAYDRDTCWPEGFIPPPEIIKWKRMEKSRPNPKAAFLFAHRPANPKAPAPLHPIVKGLSFSA
jgi:hypothetical protein